MPKVSVIMPVYNGEKYLREALDSIIAQTFTDWECIIVNEFGSSKAATMILQEYAAIEPRLRIIQNKTRLHIAESLNVGLRAAKGDYIARMDADDICGKERLRRQVDYLDKNPDIDICGLSVDMFGENAWDWKIYCEPNELRCGCLFYTPFVHPTIMARSKRLRQFELEYDPRFTYTEDYDFFVRGSKYLNYTNLKEKGLYKYRRSPQNATDAGGKIGIRFQNEVMSRTFSEYGLDFSIAEIRILSPNSFPTPHNVEDALEKLEILDLLLKRILMCDSIRRKFGIDVLYDVLHRRWMDVSEKYRWMETLMADGRVKRAIERGLFHHEHFYMPETSQRENATPLVSIILPTYNSQDYILDTLYSLLEQNYKNFELLIVNEFGTKDQTIKCISLFNDKRIHVLQNAEKLGLAESLNRGIKEAAGVYIARADADDVYPRNRLSKQVKFLEDHPEISICGSWQRHFGKRDYIHKPAELPQEIKANLLFKCDVCHSTVMFRKSEFQKYALWYDSSYLSEDYELWTRAVQNLNFATIPEILGEYRWNGENITAKKISLLDQEAQKIIARTLNETLGIVVPEEDLVLLSGWENPFSGDNAGMLRQREDELLCKIEEVNKNKSVYDNSALKRALDQRRDWAGIARQNQSMEKHMQWGASGLTRQRRNGFGGMCKRWLKNVFKRLYRPFRSRYEARLITIMETGWQLENEIQNLQQIIYDFKGNIYDYYEEMLKRLAQAERNLSESMDARIWKAEQALTESMDARIWKAERTLTESMDARIWRAEQEIAKNIIQTVLDETHRHIDLTYRDIMIAMQRQKAFLPENEIRLETDFPVACESLDHIYPHGTIRDNTRYPRFVRKCEDILNERKNLAFLDLGCSGGGMVLEAALRGHLSIGLEGSDCSQKEQRAEWRLLGSRLQTCDITKPFSLLQSDGMLQQFDVITAWEVLEHIAEADLPGLFNNIKNHLSPTGIFVGSIANWDDIDPTSGVNWHVTVHPVEWWEEKFKSFGFSLCTELFDTIDLARGGFNPPNCYEPPYSDVDTQKSFHIAVQYSGNKSV